MGKSFIPDKVVVEEVDEYEFFVLIKRDQAGLNFLQGYWSKNLDKQWSLNTIVIFPHCQFNGYGQLMITFSYLFLKVEGVAGTPERPLCTKGRESFEKFRKASVLKYLRSGWKLDLQEMSLATGIVDEDLLRAMRPIRKNSEHEGFLNSPDWKKVETLERRTSAKQLLVEKSLNLDGWPEPENPIKKKLCHGCRHFGKKIRMEPSGLIFCASCPQKNRHKI